MRLRFERCFLHHRATQMIMSRIFIANMRINGYKVDKELRVTVHQEAMFHEAYTGPNRGYEFARRYECIKLLEYHKRQKILQTDRSFVFYV